MTTATNWLNSAHVTAYCEKQAAFRKLTAEEYAEQLKDLIEAAGEYLPEHESDKVLMDAFRLLYDRLDIRPETKLVRRKA